MQERIAEQKERTSDLGLQALDLRDLSLRTDN
jgi:hypothetical protein